MCHIVTSIHNDFSFPLCSFHLFLLYVPNCAIFELAFSTFYVQKDMLGKLMLWVLFCEMPPRKDFFALEPDPISRLLYEGNNNNIRWHAMSRVFERKHLLLTRAKNIIGWVRKNQIAKTQAPLAFFEFMASIKPWKVDFSLIWRRLPCPKVNTYS